MGCFSWLYSDTGKAMICGKTINSYLLVPPAFQDKYGEYIMTPQYDGYGNFGEYDVYDLIVEWNKEFLSTEMLRLKDLKLENFGGLCKLEENLLRKQGLTEAEIEAKDLENKQYYYNLAVESQRLMILRLKIYKNGASDEEMLLRYGKYWKRELGNDIACYDEQNEKLPYPIKITSKPMKYDEVQASKKDINQGCL